MKERSKWPSKTNVEPGPQIPSDSQSRELSFKSVQIFNADHHAISSLSRWYKISVRSLGLSESAVKFHLTNTPAKYRVRARHLGGYCLRSDAARRLPRLKARSHPVSRNAPLSTLAGRLCQSDSFADLLASSGSNMDILLQPLRLPIIRSADGKKIASDAQKGLAGGDALGTHGAAPQKSFPVLRPSFVSSIVGDVQAPSKPES